MNHSLLLQVKGGQVSGSHLKVATKMHCWDVLQCPQERDKRTPELGGGGGDRFREDEWKIRQGRQESRGEWTPPLASRFFWEEAHSWARVSGAWSVRAAQDLGRRDAESSGKVFSAGW